MTRDRGKSSKNPESARRRDMRGNDKGQPNEYEPLREDINKTWTSWMDSNSNTSDVWRRIEQSGLDNALKKLASAKPELTVVSGLSSDDAENVNTVMFEFCEMLNAIRLSFVDNEKEIFDSDEREKRYLTTSCPHIINIWNSYCTFASNYATAFVGKGWLNSSEHRELLSTLNEVVASSVKLIVLSVNMAAYHSLNDTELLLKEALQESTNVAKDTEVYLAKYNELSEDSTWREKQNASDRLLEILGWMLNGLNHMSNKVIKIAIEATEPEGSLDDYDAFIESLTSLTKALQTTGETGEEETPTPQQQQQQEEKAADKKSSKNNKKKNSKADQSKDTKTADPPKEEGKKSKDGYLDVIQKFSNAYNKFSDDAWKSKRVPSIKGSNGVQVKYRTENFDQLGKLQVEPCAVTQRKKLLEDLGLTDNHVLHSDIYVISPEPLTCTQEVTVQFPLMTRKDNLCLKIKTDGKWTDVENPEIIADEDDQLFITFNTTSCEAFTALTVSQHDTVTVPLQGHNYVSRDNGKIEVAFPEGCFDTEVTIDISVMEFDEESSKSDTFVGIVGASEAIKLTCRDSGVKMNKNITVQLPIADDEDDKDTELVVARCNDQDVQILDKRQFTIKQHNSAGLYSVDIRGFWCVAILRIKRIFLNMKETIKKEFQTGYGLKYPCSILTFIDDMTRREERQTFVMEVVEKKEADDVVENKKQMGLVEVKRSRSKDVLLQRGDQVKLQIDGQMRGTEAMTENDLTLCYICGCSNVIFVDTEIKRDPEKLPDAMLFYKQPASDSTLHSVAIMTRDLSELPTDEITARTVVTTIKNDQKKGKDSEESAIQILKMESLMSLARELTVEESCELGEQLGVRSDVIKHIVETQGKDHTGANFQILCEWRGRFARATMADFLVSSLKAIGKIKFADLVTEVRKYNRGLEKSDFRSNNQRQKKNLPA